MPALLFDLDDTILSHDDETWPAWEQTYDKFAQYLKPSKSQLLDTIRKYSTLFWADPERHRLGRLNLKKARRHIISQTFSELKITDSELLEKFADHFTNLRDQLIHPFPGAIETIKHFYKKGFPMALITNGAKDMQTAKIDRFNLRQYFKNILIEGEFGTGKPDPKVFLHTLNILHAKPEDTWMIGDNLECDIAGAQAVKIKAIWNNFSNKTLPNNAPIQPDIEIHSITELVAHPDL